LAEVDLLAGVLPMPLVIFLVIFLDRVAVVRLDRRYIKALIFVTTWRSLLSKRPRVTPPKFGFLAGAIARLVMALVLNLAVSQKNVQLVMAMAKFGCSKVSFPCSKLAQSVAVLVNIFLSLARLVTAAVSIKSKKHLRLRSLRELMMVCAFAL
jgi:hypothetical protein